MKWKKFFDKMFDYIMHNPKIDIPTFKIILEINKECISPKNWNKHIRNFLMLENINTKQLSLSKFTTKKGDKPK